MRVHVVAFFGLELAVFMHEYVPAKLFCTLAHRGAAVPDLAPDAVARFEQ